ncbi:MAG: DUF2695 domain-containing protein [Bryobacteraceae bacterium]
MRLVSGLPAEKEALEEFFGALSDALDVEECDAALRHTIRLAPEFGIPVEPLVEWLMERGGYCDCEIFLNVIPDHPGFVLPFEYEDEVPQGDIAG